MPSSTSSSDSTPKSYSSRSSSLTQSFIRGFGIGLMEVAVNHWLWRLKTMSQDQKLFSVHFRALKDESLESMRRGGLSAAFKKLVVVDREAVLKHTGSPEFSPRLLLRGIVPNALSMGPITGLQVGLDATLKRNFYPDGTLSTAQRFMTSAAAGALASLVSSPTEMVMAHQGRRGMPKDFKSVAQHILRTGGVKTLYRGLFGMMLRDGGFSSAYLTAFPILKEYLDPEKKKGVSSALLASVGVGVAAAIGTQAPDTVQNKQKLVAFESNLGFVKTAGKLYQEGGRQAFFVGGAPRGVRVVSALLLMGGTNYYLESSEPRASSRC